METYLNLTLASLVTEMPTLLWINLYLDSIGAEYVLSQCGLTQTAWDRFTPIYLELKVGKLIYGQGKRRLQIQRSILIALQRHGCPLLDASKTAQSKYPTT